MDFDTYAEYMQKALKETSYQVCSHGKKALCRKDLDTIVPISNRIVEAHQ